MTFVYVSLYLQNRRIRVNNYIKLLLEGNEQMHETNYFDIDQ